MIRLERRLFKTRLGATRGRRMQSGLLGNCVVTSCDVMTLLSACERAETRAETRASFTPESFDVQFF
jgi:hypothetical protein